MRHKSTGVIAALALVTGLAGFAATGCQNLDVGTSIQPPDTTGQPAFDDPTGQNPGNNVIPAQREDTELELPGR